MIVLRNKAFISGLGVGFIVLSIIFYIATFIKGSPNPEESNTVTVVEQLTDEEIIEKAKDLGMTEGSSEPIIQYETLTESEIILRAAALGMIFLESEIREIAGFEEDNLEEIESYIETAYVDSSIEENTEIASFISLRIMGGWSAVRICQFLAENGVVDDAERFQTYLSSRNLTHSLKAGTLVFPLNADYQEIVRVLMKEVEY